MLATDGVSTLLDHFDHNLWADLAHYDNAQLAALLDRIHRWEERDDPNGRHLPRAKQHDDKTIAAIGSIW